MSETVFGMLAMSAMEAPRALMAESAEYLRRNQGTDGGWRFTAGSPSDPSEAEITGAALAALCTTGATPADPAVARGIAFLESQFDPSDGRPSPRPSVPTRIPTPGLSTVCRPAKSTSKRRLGPRRSVRPRSGLSALAAAPSGPNAGSFEYEGGEGEAFLNLYATQDALRALAGGRFVAFPPVSSAGPEIPAGTPVPLTLLVDTGFGNPRLCRVVAPVGSMIVEVLGRRRPKPEANGPCVCGLSVNGQGVVTSLNGVANSAGHEWVASSTVTFETPPGAQEVEAGDFIRLRFPGAAVLEATGASVAFGEVAEGSIGRGKDVYVRISEAPTEPRFSVTGAQREDFLVSAGTARGR